MNADLKCESVKALKVKEERDRQRIAGLGVVRVDVENFFVERRGAPGQIHSFE
ncbi:MAG: hypothetical protein ACRD5G_05730 [Candidatus Acidiferrales bacterium]